MKNLMSFNDYSQLRSQSKKNGRREKVNQNKCAFSSQNQRVRKEEGATVAASHLPSPWRNSAGWSRKGRTGRDSPRRFHFTGKPHKIPQMSYLRYETPAFSDK
jgi:hypothetical protein